MPTRRRTRRRTLRPTRGNNFIIYFVIIVLAFSLLIWAISLIPVQVWLYLLIVVGVLALVAVAWGIVFLVHRGQGQTSEEIISVAPTTRMRRRVTSQPSTYQQGYQSTDQSFWQAMKNLKTRGDLFNLTYTQFEHACADVLRSLGYTEVERTGKAGDRGVDIRAIDPNGKKTIAQCKQHNIGIKANSGEFQAFIGAMSHHRAQRGIFFTTSEFTPEVMAMNKDGNHGVLLIDGKMLVQLIHQVEALQDQQNGHF